MFTDTIVSPKRAFRSAKQNKQWKATFENGARIIKFKSSC